MYDLHSLFETRFSVNLRFGHVRKVSFDFGKILASCPWVSLSLLRQNQIELIFTTIPPVLHFTLFVCRARGKVFTLVGVVLNLTLIFVPFSFSSLVFFSHFFPLFSSSLTAVPSGTMCWKQMVENFNIALYFEASMGTIDT